MARCGRRASRSALASARNSLSRSFVPITSTATRGCAASRRMSKIAVGVSTIAQMRIVAGAPPASSSSETRSRVAVSATLGMTTAAAPERAAAARSSAPHGVSSPLQRIVSSRRPYSPDDAATTALARAASLASGATASSRSKMMASAAISLALARARSLAAGMYSTDRRGRRVSSAMSGSDPVERGEVGIARGELFGETDHDPALLDRGVVLHLAVEHDRPGAVAHGLDDPTGMGDLGRRR